MAEQDATLMSLPEQLLETIIKLATSSRVIKTLGAVRLTCSSWKAKADWTMTWARAVSDEQLAILASKFPNLKELEIDFQFTDRRTKERREVTSASMAHLCQLSRLASLELWYNQARLDLSPLHQLQHLTNIQLVDTPPRHEVCHAVAGLDAVAGQLKSLELDGLDGVPNKLGRFSGLRNLTMSRVGLGDGLSFLRELDCLETLTFTECSPEISPPDLCHLSYLRRVDIEDCRMDNLDVFGPSLTALEIRNHDNSTLENRVGEEDEFVGVPQRNLPNVKQLALCNVQFREPIALASWVPAVERLKVEGMSLIPNLHLHGLSHLKVLNHDCCTEAGELQGLNSLTALEVLRIGCRVIFDSEPTSLGNLEGLAALRVLRVSNLSWLDELPLWGLQRLSVLSVLDCPRLGTLTGLSDATALKSLRLFTLDGLDAIPNLSSLEQLQDLVISFCRNVATIPGLGALGKLSELDLSYLPKITTLDGLELLTSLTKLSLQGISGLAQIPSLASLRALRDVQIEGCNNLSAAPGLEGLAGDAKVQCRACQC